MEKRYDGATWDEYFQGDAAGVRVEAMTWAHWPPHRALMWMQQGNGYHPLIGDFLTRMRESLGEGRTRFLGLVTADERLVGTAVLRPHDCWSGTDSRSYVLDLYVHRRFRAATDMLYSTALPNAGRVQTFLSGASSEQVAFFSEKGFRLEASLKDDFNHHDEGMPDIRVYGKTLEVS